MTRAHIDSDTDSDTTRGGVVHQEEDQHEWKEATIRDSRSVCPALNAMANHHYLPHSGHNLTFPMISQALRECYNLTYFLSYFLALGGFLVIGLFPFGWNGWTRIELRDLGKKMGDSYDDRSEVKNWFLRLIAVGTEHNASLVHANVAPGESHLTPSPFPTSSLITRFLPHNTYVTDIDVAHERIRRESEVDGGPIDAVHAEIARGEMAIILNVWRNGEKGVEREVMVDWLEKERLDLNRRRWKTGMLDVVRTTVRMKKEMQRVREKVRGL